MKKQVQTFTLFLALILFPMVHAAAYSVPAPKIESNSFTNLYFNYSQGVQNSNSLKSQKALPHLFASEASISLINHYVQTKSNSENNWVVIKTVDGVIVSYKESSCQGQPKLILKIENNNSTDVTVKLSFWGEKEYRTISVGAQETIIGECKVFNSPLELDIPSDMTIVDLDAIITLN